MRNVLLVCAITICSALPAYSQKDRYIPEWLVCGSFRSMDGFGNLNEDYFGEEGKIYPEAGAFAGGRVWESHRADREGFVDFRAMNLPFEEFCVAYAAVYVGSNVDRSALLEIETEERVSILLNGKGIAPPDGQSPVRSAVNLRIGLNRLLIKLENTTLDWRLRARFLDLEGKPMDGLETTVENHSPINEILADQVYPRLIFRTASVGGRFVLRSDGVFVYRLTSSLFNVGTLRAAGVKMDLPKGLEIVGHPGETEFSLPDLSAQEAMYLSFDVAAENLIKSILEGRVFPVRVGMESGWETLSVSGGVPERILINLLDGIILEDWKSETDGADGSGGKNAEVGEARGDFRRQVDFAFPGLLKRMEFRLLWHPTAGIDLDEATFGLNGKTLGYASGGKEWSCIIDSSDVEKKNRLTVDFRGVRSLDRIPLAVGFRNTNLEYIRRNAPILLRMGLMERDKFRDMAKTILSGIVSGQKKAFAADVTNWAAKVQLSAWEARSYRVGLVNLPSVADFECSDGLSRLSEEDIIRELTGEPSKYEGEAVKCLWNPVDDLHVSTLPQVLRQAGIDLYIYKGNPSVDKSFWWEGIDGSRIPVCPGSTESILGMADRAVDEFRRTGSKSIILIRPEKDELDSELLKYDAFPTIEEVTPEAFIRDVTARSADFPVVRGDFGIASATEGRSSDGCRFDALKFTEDSMRAMRIFAGADPRFKDSADVLFAGRDSVGNAGGNCVAIAVVNPFPWTRTGPVEFNLPATAETGFRLRDPKGDEVPSQVVREAGSSGAGPVKRLLFTAEDVPGVGFRVYRLEAGDSGGLMGGAGDSLSLDNGLISVAIDAECGGADIFAQLGPSVGASGASSAMEELTYSASWRTTAELKSVQVLEQGPIRRRQRIVSGNEDGEIYSDLAMWTGVPWLEVTVTVVPKGKDAPSECFSVSESVIKGASCTWDIPFGFERGIEEGVWIRPMRWIDFSFLWDVEYAGGFALLTDGKSNCSVKNGCLGFSWAGLSSVSDRRTFRYAFFPHRGDFRTGNVVRRAFEYGAPMVGVALCDENRQLPREGSFLSLQGEGIAMTALGPSADGKGITLRFFECHGRPTKGRLILPKGFRSIERTDLSGRSLGVVSVEGETMDLDFRAYEIRTFLVRF